MAIARVSGNILQDNLQRGANLAVQGNLVFFDVVNDRVGIRTVSTTHDLTVAGNLLAGNITIDTNTISGTANIVIAPTGNILVSSVNIRDVLDPVQAQDAATKNYVDTELANVFTFADSAANTTSVGSGDTVQVLGTANEIDVAVGNLSITVGLTDDVIIANSLTVTANITTTGNIDATGNVTGGNLNTPGDVVAVGNVFAQNITGSGNISLGNLAISNTTITTSLAQGNITLTPTGNSTVIIDATSGLVLPAGNTAQRPDNDVAGTVRFNSSIARVEVYDGNDWEDIVANVTAQVLEGDGSTLTFVLDRSGTAASTLVIINGIVQLPTVSYGISGNSLIFTQAPVVSDVIDIRFL